MYVVFEPLAVILFIIAGVAILWMAKFLFGSYVAPIGIFGTLWCFSLAVYYLGISQFYILEIGTLLVFVGTIILFLLGAIVASGLTGFNRTFPRPIKTGYLRGASQLHQLVYVLFAIGVLGTVTYYLRLHQLIGIESLWLNPVRVRYAESASVLRQTGWFGASRSLLTPCFVLAVIYLNLPGRKPKRLMWFVAGMSFLLLLPSSGRTTIATMIIWAILATIYLIESTGRNISAKRYAMWLLIVLPMFVVYFLVTTNFLRKAVYNEAGIADVSLYTGSSFPAFQEMVKSPESFTQHTSLTFGVLSRILNEIDPSTFAYPDYVQPHVSVPALTNVYTYLDAYFLDLGWFGVFFFPFVLGMLTTGLYLSMRKSPSVAKIYAASLFGLCIFQSTGVNRFGNFGVWFWIFIPFVATNLIALFGSKWTGTGAYRNEQGRYFLK